MANNAVKFTHIDNEQKRILLTILGYSVDSEGYLINHRTKKPHICPITNEKVKLEKASILPGSELVINTTPLSIAQYLEKHVE